MALLGVKLDSATWLRQGKRAKDPDPAQLAALADLGGADALALFIGSHRRHARDRDVYLLKEIVRSRFILQMAPRVDLMNLALEVRPWMVELVSENAVDPTAVEPLDYANNSDSIAEASERLKGAGIIPSHFIRPDAEDAKQAARLKAQYVTLATMNYTNAATREEAETEVDDIERISQLANKMGLGINCGGGLTYKNVAPLAEMNLMELVIVGRAVIQRALLVGMERAVSELRAELNRRI